MTFLRLGRLVPLLLPLVMAACVGAPPPPRLTLKPASFHDLAGWRDDHVAEALTAFVKSCAELTKRNDGDRIGPATLALTAADWRSACGAASQTPPDDEAARAFFEREFTPYLAANNEEQKGCSPAITSRCCAARGNVAARFKRRSSNAPPIW